MKPPTPDPSCREDYKNSVILDGKIDDALIARISPQILELRANKTPIITVYINSNGGHIHCADAIRSLLTFRGVDGYSPWLVTVAFGNAKSAAANLLALGDYAIAYPNSSIHFHGVRLSEVPNLTMEDASFFADYLVSQNAQTALRLANAAIERTFLHYIDQRPYFSEVRAAKGELHDSECFLHRISSKLHSDRAKEVIKKALQHYNDNRELTQFAVAKANSRKGTRSNAAYDADVLRLVVTHLTRKRDDKRTGLTDKKLSEIFSAYKLLRDFHLGPHTRELKTMIKRYGQYLLDKEGREEFASKEAAPAEEREAWLEQKVWPTIKPLWYLVVATWQALQEEENPLTPNDAYWLGVVDEVAGTDLAGKRLLLEAGDETETEPEVSIPQ